MQDLSSYSRFVQRLRRRYADALQQLPAGAPVLATMQACFDTLRQTHSCGDSLRMLRQLVMERLVVLDCEQRAELHVITRAVTELGEFTLDAAFQEARTQLDASYGVPTTPSGERATLWIIGMGKFGARELNVSSDIDLIYVYDEDGETTGLPDGRGRISNHDYFAKAVKLIYALVGDTTEHGFVFRMDLALRPTATLGRVWCHVNRWKSISWCKGASGNALPGSRAAWSPPSAPRPMRLNCATPCCPLCFVATWTTACLRPCVGCTSKFASTRSHAARAGLSAPTM